jgi:hypothetical protein
MTAICLFFVFWIGLMLAVFLIPPLARAIGLVVLVLLILLVATARGAELPWWIPPAQWVAPASPVEPIVPVKSCPDGYEVGLTERCVPAANLSLCRPAAPPRHGHDGLEKFSTSPRPTLRVRGAAASRSGRTGR